MRAKLNIALKEQYKDKRKLVDGFLYQLDFETSTSINTDESKQIPSENKIGGVFTLCL